MQDSTWILELVVKNKACMRINYDGHVYFFDHNSPPLQKFVMIYKIPEKTWRKEYVIKILQAPTGAYIVSETKNLDTRIRLSNGICLCNFEGHCLNNEYSKWLVAELLLIFEKHDSQTSVIPEMLRAKFPHSKIKVVNYNEQKSDIEFLVQRTCGTACDDFGSIYSSDGEFLRSAGSQKPIPNACADIYRPVCGSNHITYSNKCHMALQTKNTVRKGKDGTC